MIYILNHHENLDVLDLTFCLYTRGGYCTATGNCTCQNGGMWPKTCCEAPCETMRGESCYKADYMLQGFLL